jgi:hypothetical protein
VVQNTLCVAHSDCAETADIIIEELLKQVDESYYDQVFKSIRTASIDPVAGLPLYEFAWPRLGYAFSQTADPPMAITHLIVFSQLLSDELESRNVERIRAINLDPEYQAVVQDVASDHGLATLDVTVPSRAHRIRGLLVGISTLLIGILDQLFSIIWSIFHNTDKEKSASTIFVPLVNRFDSMKPVIEAYEGTYQVILPTATVSWLRDVRHRVPELGLYDPIPIGSYATVKMIARESVAFFYLAISLFGDDEFHSQIQDFVTKEFNICLDATLTYVLSNFYQVHLRSLPNLFVAQRMIDRLEITNLVIGSMGSRQQAILYAARACGCQTYHIPHTATTGYELLPPKDTLHFVPSDVAVQHLDNSNQSDDISNLVPVGRPQLATLYSERPESLNPPTLPYRIVIATQPFDDSIRERFVKDTVDSIISSNQQCEIIIKIHPNESPEYYRDLLDEDRVSIVTDELHRNIKEADLVITVNSNVGLEAMVLGTPVICINEWEPMVRTRPYALKGPIPVLKSTREIRTYLDNLDPKALTNLREDQDSYVLEKYYLTNQPGKEIAKSINNPDSIS